MAIALASVADRPLAVQAGALVLVGLMLTVGVYGVVGLIVKMDDIGVHLAQRRPAGVRRMGRMLVRAMPPLLEALSVIGTAAMLWVGGGIIVHGLEHFHLEPLPGLIHRLSQWAGSAPVIGPVTGWFAFAVASALIGLMLGALITGLVHLIPRRAGAH